MMKRMLTLTILALALTGCGGSETPPVAPGDQPGASESADEAIKDSETDSDGDGVLDAYDTEAPAGGEAPDDEEAGDLAVAQNSVLQYCLRKSQGTKVPRPVEPVDTIIAAYEDYPRGDFTVSGRETNTVTLVLDANEALVAGGCDRELAGKLNGALETQGDLDDPSTVLKLDRTP